MHQSCNLTDPVILHELNRLPYTVAQHAYMLALAAFQRGLQVTFHHSLGWHERFAKMRVQGHRGEMLSVSDGVTTRYFRRTLADSVSPELSLLCDHKQATKVALHKAGVTVPPGLMVTTGEEPEIAPFLERYPGHTFLLKPLSGSLGEGVVRSIPADQVMAEIQRVAGRPHLLEVFLRGREFRIFVVNHKVVAAHERVPAHVVGNGRNTVEELVNQRNALRAKHPVYRDYPIVLNELALKTLSSQGITPQSIPVDGAVAWLNRIPAFREGGHNRPIPLSELTPLMQSTAIAATRAIGTDLTGMDVMVPNMGTPEEQVFVLELNQSPHLNGVLGGLPFGAQPAFNAVAEALIDHHFPESVDNPRHTRASFDLTAIINLMSTGTVATVQLPRLTAGWKHVRLTVAPQKASTINVPGVLLGLLQQGLHVRCLRTDGGAMLVDAVVPDDRVDALKAALDR